MLLREGGGRVARAMRALTTPAPAPKEPTLRRQYGSSGGFAATADPEGKPQWLNDSRSNPLVNSAALRDLRKMSRGFARGSTLMGAYVDALVNNTLGPRYPTPEWGKNSGVTDAMRDRMLERWQSFLRAPVGAGGLSGREVLRLALRHTIIDGDVLLVPMRSPNGLVGFNFFLGDELDEARRERRVGGSFIQNGVEVDHATGIVRGYWVRSAGAGGNLGFISTFLPASKVLHLSRTESLKAYRGLPWATPVLDAMRQVSAYDRAYLSKLILGARVYTAITSDINVGDTDTDAIRTGFGKNEEGGNAIDDMRLTDGEILKMPPGYQIAPIDIGSRSLGELEFRTRKVNEICAALGIMPARMTGGYDQINFSAARMAAAVEQRKYRDVQQWLVAALLEPVFRMVVSDVLASGEVATTARGQRALLHPDWRFAAWPSTEIHRELPSLIKAVDNGLMSRTQALRILGDADPRNTAEDLGREREEFMRVGVWDDLAQNRAVKAAAAQGNRGGRPATGNTSGSGA